MKESLVNKLQQLVSRHEEIAGLLSDPEVMGDQNRFRDLSQEYARLDAVATLFSQFEQTQEDLTAADEMRQDSDEEIRKLGEDEYTQTETRLEGLETELRKHLIPVDNMHSVLWQKVVFRILFPL